MTASPTTRTATFLLRQQRQAQGYREVLHPGTAAESLAQRAEGRWDESFWDGGSAQATVIGKGSPVYEADVFEQGVFSSPALVIDNQPPALTLLWIPPGRFWMGSPATELDRREDQGPQHLVQLQGFFMAQTPITQAQWRAVAGWREREGERWGRELEQEPSFFQSRGNPNAANYAGSRFSLLQGESNSDQRPVENVSWLDAMEFCHRLSQRTGRHYTLPSEAQWEYACRAGSTTPFAFGATLTAELANYEATSAYGDGPKGEYREQTTPVGMFAANAWGLQDMHGNVWEWCLDEWHENYEGAPADGSAWVGGDDVKSADSDKSRLLRGGSWGLYPRGCRSAVRYPNLPDYADFLIGLRVVCLPQAPSLNA